MCIIVKKDAGTKIDFKMLNNCFDRNSDGAGFMFVSDRGVEIYKGYMKFKTFKRAVKRLCNDDMEIVFHFRISTSLLTNTGNTHPFPVCDSFEKYQSTHQIVDTAMCHNGVMSQYEKHDEYSDTQHFVHDFLYPLKACGANLFDEKLIPAIKAVIGNANKLAIMDKDKGVTLIGNFVTDKKYDGYTFSNSSYEGISYWKSTKNTWSNFVDDWQPFRYANKYENGKKVESVTDYYDEFEDDDYYTECDKYGNIISTFDNLDNLLDEVEQYTRMPYDAVLSKSVREYFRQDGEVYYASEDDIFVLQNNLTLYYVFADIIDEFNKYDNQNYSQLTNASYTL